MKNRNLLLTVAVFFGMISGLTAQNVPSYMPTNGLVGWWPFNGNANDESGNSRNGIIYGGVTASIDRFGQDNSSFEFNGNDGFVEISNSTDMNYPDGYSLSGWINFTQNQPDNNVFSKHSTNIQNGFILGIQDNKARFYSSSINMLSAESINNGNWHHLVATFNGSTMKLYLDNQKQDTINQQYLPNSFKVNIGKANGCCYFSGKIDDVAIYNRALSQQEITSLYQGANTTTNCPTFPASLAQGLVGYWPFCGNALDESGNGNHGTVNGATLTTDRFGNSNAAYRFPTPLSNIETSSWFSNIQNTYTLSSWIFLTDSSFNVSAGDTVMTVLLHRAHNNDKAIFLYAPNIINYRDNLDNQGTLVPTETLTNKWAQVTFTSTNDSLTLFLNGLLIRKTPRVNVSNWSTNYHGSFLGGNSFDNNWSTNFNGSLDDIAIWNRALTPQEIKQVYNQGICQTSITVTDTLLIHTGITSYNPVAYGNTLKVWPNPGNTAITLDAGNLALMQGWKIRVSNAQGVQIFPSGGQSGLISQQQQTLDMSNWGGNGLYFLYLIDPQNNIQEVKKIVLAP